MRHIKTWTPYAASRVHRTDLNGEYAVMWIASVLGILIVSFLAYKDSPALYIASPILLLWLLAPLLSWRLSKEEKEKKPNLSKAQNLFLHKSARKTWAYFEEFVT